MTMQSNTGNSASPRAGATREVDYRRSYSKTALVAAAGLILTLGALTGSGAGAMVTLGSGRVATGLLWLTLAAALFVASMLLGLLFLGSLIVLHRDRLESTGRPYVAGPREAHGGPLSFLWSWARRGAHRVRGVRSLCLRPGETVQVRPLDEILATLDDRGTRNGLPFMPEMARHCGSRQRVFRRVEKLNDYIDHRGLRRMPGFVMLEGVQCDGTSHGGCQARCYTRWHEDWLRRAPGAPPPVREPASRSPLVTELPVLLTVDGETRYRCQVTELTADSTPIGPARVRDYVRELVIGNARIRPFLVGTSLALFRWVQNRRGGVEYPVIEPRAGKTSPSSELMLRPGEWVRVKSKREIEDTLNDKSRNRGLWFDHDMIRYCGGRYRVSDRVSDIIVEKTGKLVHLTNPCVTLDGVRATGEYLAFNAEADSIFWREVWLERTEAP